MLQLPWPGRPVTYGTPYALSALPIICPTVSFIGTSMSALCLPHILLLGEEGSERVKLPATSRARWLYNPVRVEGGARLEPAQVSVAERPTVPRRSVSSEDVQRECHGPRQSTSRLVVFQ